MKIKKKYIAFPILTLFLCYGLNPEFFERKFLLNEFLSFLGFLTFLLYTFKGNKVVIPRSNLYRLALAVQILGLVHLIFSFSIKTNLYFYLRNSVIVYSIFSFFLGFYFFNFLKGYFALVRILFASFLIPTVLLGIKSFLDRYSGSVFFPFLFRRLNIVSLTGVLLLNIIYAITFESMTVGLISILLGGIIILRSYRLLRAAVVMGFIGFVGLLIYFAPNVELYKTGPYSLFGNVRAVIDSHYLLGLDHNSTWRLVFWYRLIVENFPQNILGIGLGTPLLDYIPGQDTAFSNYDDEYDIHVMGSHNTYLTVAARLGLLFPVLLVLIYRRVFREFYRWFGYYNYRRNLLIFISFFTVSIIGLFNLLLESPIYASLYWMLLGFVAKAIEVRKAEMYGLSQSPQHLEEHSVPVIA
jgi:hypothetical protein